MCLTNPKKNMRPDVRLWWERRGPNFLFPPCYPGHQHRWQKIAMDAVGCDLCGVVHLCGEGRNIVPCCQAICDDTSIVCTLTGVVTQSTSFFSNEISNTDFRITSVGSHVSTKTPVQSSAEKMETVCRVCRQVLEMLLYSKQAEEARQRELGRIEKKTRSVFAASCTALRSRIGQNHTFCILNALEDSIAAMQRFERRDASVEIPPIEAWEDFVSHVSFTLTFLNMPVQYAPSIGSENFRNIVLAVIYMAKNGLTVNGAEFIPTVKVLAKILPLEVFLWSSFQVPSKVITEGENLIKTCINGMNAEHFRQYNRNRPLATRTP